jgi:hypothetical protein
MAGRAPCKQEPGLLQQPSVLRDAAVGQAGITEIVRCAYQLGCVLPQKAQVFEARRSFAPVVPGDSRDAAPDDRDPARSR